MPPPPQIRPVTISFNRKGVLPPVYIASTFTDPPWESVEMSFEADKGAESAHFRFTATFDNVHPGEHQYKFRIGPGDEGWTIDEDADMTVEGDHANNWLVVKSPKPPETLQQWSPAPTSVTPMAVPTTDRTFAHEKLETSAPADDHARIELYGMQDARQLWLDDPHTKKAPELATIAEESEKPAEAPAIETGTTARAEAAAHEAKDVNIDVMSSRIAVALKDDVPSDLSTDMAMALDDQHQRTTQPRDTPPKSHSSAAVGTTKSHQGTGHDAAAPRAIATTIASREEAGHKAGIEHIRGQLYANESRDKASTRAKRYQGWNNCIELARLTFLRENQPLLSLAMLLAAAAILWYMLHQGKALVGFV